MERARSEPDAVRKDLLDNVRTHPGPDIDLEPHLSPRYRPWQQRIAFEPDGGLFRAFREGKARVATDTIRRFVPDGVELASRKVLEADVIITASGFNMSVMGAIAFDVDGKAVDFSQTVTWGGVMFTGVPNLAWVFGHFRASWTLRVDLVCDVVCRLLQHMQDHQLGSVTPRLRDDEHDMPLEPFMDPEDFSPGYLSRSFHLLPQQSNKPEWRISQDYPREREEFAAIDLGDELFGYEAEVAGEGLVEGALAAKV